MEHFEQSINTLVNKVYRDLEVLENRMLSHSPLNLSISEIHLLDAVRSAGQAGGATISELSDALCISPPSVTSAVTKLENKGFVTRCKSAQDGRLVFVRLTKLGQKAERVHRYFHRSMSQQIAAELNDEEQAALIHGITKLDLFLQQNIQKYEKK